MLEHVPHWLGSALRGVRAGSDKLAILEPELGKDFAPIELASLAFAHGGRIPERFTADGEGVSPPLAWGQVPEGTQSLSLIVEDPDAPAPQPLVHAIVWNLSPQEGALAEGAIGAEEAEGDSGRNSYFQSGWLPPDPPTGHGDHHYAFQLFALSAPLELRGRPGRGAIVEAMAGKVLGAGLLIGTYSRGEPKMAGRAETAASLSTGKA